MIILLSKRIIILLFLLVLEIIQIILHFLVDLILVQVYYIILVKKNIFVNIRIFLSQKIIQKIQMVIYVKIFMKNFIQILLSCSFNINNFISRIRPKYLNLVHRKHYSIPLTKFKKIQKKQNQQKIKKIKKNRIIKFRIIKKVSMRMRMNYSIQIC